MCLFYFFVMMLFIISLYIRFTKKKSDFILGFKKIWVFIFTPLYQIIFLLGIFIWINSLDLSLLILLFIPLHTVIFIISVLPQTLDYYNFLHFEPVQYSVNINEQNLLLICNTVFKSGLITYIFSIIFLIAIIVMSILIFSVGFLLALFVIPIFIAGIISSLFFLIGLTFFIISFVFNYLMIAINTRKILKRLNYSENEQKKLSRSVFIPFYQLFIINKVLNKIRNK